MLNYVELLLEKVDKKFVSSFKSELQSNANTTFDFDSNFEKLYDLAEKEVSQSVYCITARFVPSCDYSVGVSMVYRRQPVWIHESGLMYLVYPALSQAKSAPKMSKSRQEIDLKKEKAAGQKNAAKRADEAREAAALAASEAAATNAAASDSAMKKRLDSLKKKKGGDMMERKSAKKVSYRACWDRSLDSLRHCCLCLTAPQWEDTQLILLLSLLDRRLFLETKYLSRYLTGD